jgi:hypothetical protein
MPGCDLRDLTTCYSYEGACFQRLKSDEPLSKFAFKFNLRRYSKGLEDQLLGDVVCKERPDLEEAKDRLVVSISNDKKQLKAGAYTRSLLSSF